MKDESPLNELDESDLETGSSEAKKCMPDHPQKMLTLSGERIEPDSDESISTSSSVFYFRITFRQNSDR
jgi:hypothetical protein